MSCYDNERGTIVLPTDQVAKVKTAVRTAHDNLRKQIMAEAVRFWEQGAKRTRSPKLYTQRLEGWFHGNHANRYTSQVNLPAYLGDYLFCLLEDLSAKPRKLQAKDLDASWDFAKTTNRTTVFPVGEGSISFKGREVCWNSGDNNNAVERAHQHPTGIAFFAALDQVRWTRGSGGEIYYRSEYTPMEEAAQVNYSYPPKPQPSTSYGFATSMALNRYSPNYGYRGF